MQRSQFSWNNRIRQIYPMAIALISASCLAGAASALFLYLLNQAGIAFNSHHWLLLLLPLAGFATGLTYYYFGSKVEAGINLVLQEIHEQNTYIQMRMLPFVLFGTLATHLFGGSAGREGTAIQMGSTISDQIAKLMRQTGDARKTLLLVGVASGFSSLFGTPIAGAVFALEFFVVGKINSKSFAACVIASIIADRTCIALGAHHAHYVITEFPVLTIQNIIKSLLAGLVFGLAAKAFVFCSHTTSSIIKSNIKWPPLRPALGGIVIVAGIYVFGTRYAGIGTSIISESFSKTVMPWDFAIKLALTAITVGVGFKGGEVTPLFFVGATLGNVLASTLGLPFPLLAGMGLVAVFGAAANTPIACTVMAVELFGAEAAPWAALACVAAFWSSGSSGIYAQQRHA